jgi:hypothetical protein
MNKITSEQYMVLCNLIEALWLKRLDADYYDVDLGNLPEMTSPQARRVAKFIADTLKCELVMEVEKPESIN